MLLGCGSLLALGLNLKILDSVSLKWNRCLEENQEHMLIATCISTMFVCASAVSSPHVGQPTNWVPVPIPRFYSSRLTRLVLVREMY